MKNRIEQFANKAIMFLILCLLAQCKDETLEVMTFEQKEADVASPATTNNDIDNGFEYQYGKFYTKGIDRKNVKSTKSGANEMLLTRTYTINVNEGGEYSFAAHILPVRLPSNLRKDSELQNVSVYVNGEYRGDLNITKPNWELVQIKGNKSVLLQSGINTITFESEAPFYPDIDGMRISKSAQNLLVENKQYDDYIRYLRQNVQGRELATRSAFTNQSDWKVSPVVKETPGCNYKHKEQVPIAYTYYKKLSLTKGNWTFETNPIQGESYTSVDPVMYLFKADDPHDYSYYSDDSNHFHPKITAKNIPSGDYYLVIRSKNSWNAQSALGREGLVNVFCNGELMNENMPIFGCIVEAGSSKGTMNYFTAYTTGIATFWMIEHKSNKMKFKCGDYFFMDPQDFQWFDDSRFSLNKQSDVAYDVLISARGAMGFYFGNCDFYGSVPEAGSDYLNAFPNYKKGDALRSANYSSTYNSAAWAGGLTNCVFWGKSTSGATMNNYGSPYVWETWDNYFANQPPRYANAVSYRRTYTGPAVIAVWSKDGTISGVSYFSVRGDANGQAHGYAWETKITNKGRIFHPLNALNGTEVGQVIGYYNKISDLDLQQVGTKSSKPVEMTFEESVRKGYTVIEDIRLDEEQEQLIKTYNLLTRSALELDDLYKKWGERINGDEYIYTSNPYELIETKEGQDLMNYAKQHLEESIPFFTGIMFSDEARNTLEGNIAPFMFCDLLQDSHAPLMEAIKEDWKKNSRTKDGAYIAPLPINFAKKYAKSILDKEFLNRDIKYSINERR